MNPSLSLPPDPASSPTALEPAVAAVVAVETEAMVIARLSMLKPMDYDRVRKEEAKALGVQVKTLDDMIKASRSEDREANRLPFVDHEPADDPVDPAGLLNEIVAVIRKFVVLDQEQADACALWAVHTHLVEVADTSPILIVNAPERACAKTLLQALMARICYRPLPASNASLSALFRAVEHWGPTILIDEADTFFRDQAELAGMVNAGYKRGGFVLRSEASGDSYEPRMFSVYGPKSIAGIALERHLPDATMSRGIVINMRRKLQHETVERMRNADDREFDLLASQIARFAMDHAQQLRLSKPHLPNALSDRCQDNWEPLLAIAACAGPVWLKRATKAALKLSAASESQSSTGNDLLADIKDVFDGTTATKISTADLLTKLVADDEKSWATYNRGKPITPRQLAKQLDAYGIKSKTVRMGPSSTPKGYELAQFDDAFKRYLKPPKAELAAGASPGPAVAETPQQPADAALPELLGPEPICGVADAPAVVPEDLY